MKVEEIMVGGIYQSESGVQRKVAKIVLPCTVMLDPLQWSNRKSLQCASLHDFAKWAVRRIDEVPG